MSYFVALRRAGGLGQAAGPGRWPRSPPRIPWGPEHPGRWGGFRNRPLPGGRARPRASDPGPARERWASGLRAADPPPGVARPLPACLPASRAVCIRAAAPWRGRESDFGKRKSEKSKPPSLAQIYEWLLQPEELLKPLHSMTFILLHLIYLVLRRGGGR